MPAPIKSTRGGTTDSTSSSSSSTDSSSHSHSPPKSLIQIDRIDPDHYARRQTPETGTRSVQSSTTPGSEESDASTSTPQSRTTSSSTPTSSSTALIRTTTAAPAAVSLSVSPVAPVKPVLSITQRALAEASSGLGGAIFSACCVYPIDLVKTRIQLPNSPYTSLLGGMAQIVREEGFLTLYTGLSSEIVKASVQNFSYFYWYIVLKEWAARAFTKKSVTSTDPSATSPIIHNALTCTDIGTDLVRHQALCNDSHCFCRSVDHVAAIKQRDFEVEQWRMKAELHRRRLNTAHNPNADPNIPSTAHLRLLHPSSSEPYLINLLASNKHDIDDSPYVDVKSADQTTLITNTATVLSAASPIPAVSASPPPPPPQPQLSIGMTLLLGTLAGCITQLVVNPVSVIQTRMMTQKRGGTAIGFFSIARNVLRDEGLGAFFAGILPAFILSTNPSIQFLVFDRLKALFLRILSQSALAPRSLSILESFILGAFSKIVATLVTYPYIMAKIRLQYKGGGSGGAPAVVYKGTLDVIFRTLKYEGISGLFTGLQAQLLKSVLGAALMFMAKEKLADLAALIQRWIDQQKAKTITTTSTDSQPMTTATHTHLTSTTTTKTGTTK